MVNSTRDRMTCCLRDTFAYRGRNRHFSPLYCDVELAEIRIEERLTTSMQSITSL